MKKLSLGIFLIALFTLVTTPGLAQTQDRARIQIESTDTPTGTTVRNQNQVRTENQGEDTELNVATQEQEATSRGSLRSAERKSEVAKAVEQLLSVADRSGGIGKEIREIARTHNEGQAKAENRLITSQAQPGWRRLLLGPDFDALKEVRQEAAQMQTRIRKLEQLQNKLVNQAAIQQVQEAIQTLERERAALLQEVTTEESQFSLFGWLKKLLG